MAVGIGCIGGIFEVELGELRDDGCLDFDGIFGIFSRLTYWMYVDFIYYVYFDMLGWFTDFKSAG